MRCASIFEVTQEEYNRIEFSVPLMALETCNSPIAVCGFWFNNEAAKNTFFSHGSRRHAFHFLPDVSGNLRIVRMSMFNCNAHSHFAYPSQILFSRSVLWIWLLLCSSFVVLFPLHQPQSCTTSECRNCMTFAQRQHFGPRLRHCIMFFFVEPYRLLWKCGVLQSPSQFDSFILRIRSPEQFQQAVAALMR